MLLPNIVITWKHLLKNSRWDEKNNHLRIKILYNFKNWKHFCAITKKCMSKIDIRFLCFIKKHLQKGFDHVPNCAKTFLVSHWWIMFQFILLIKKRSWIFFLTSYDVQDWKCFHFLLQMVGKSMGTSEGTINGISNDFAWIGTMVKPWT